MSKIASLFLDSKTPPRTTELDVSKTPEKSIYRILFVDDEPNVLKTMKRIFRRENYDLITAESGKQALELLKDSDVQVVVSDYKMPGMNGADLLREVKSRYPQTIRIMLTGHADVDSIMGAVNEGAVYKFITKPWNDEDLRLTISLALEQYDLIRENKELKRQHVVHQNKIKKLSRMVENHFSQLGRMLLNRGLIKQQDLENALALQVKTNKMLPMVLMEMGIVDEATIINVIQEDMGINRVYPNEFTVPQAVTLLIPKEICVQNILVPIKRTNTRLLVAMADPTDLTKIDDLKFLTGLPVESAVAARKEILDKIQEIYGDEEIFDEAFSDLSLTDPTENIEIIVDEEDEASDLEELLRAKDKPPAIRIVNAIICDAMRHNASDIHIEPKTKYLQVRYRIDGLLRDKIHIPMSMHPAVASRIKVMSELDISERRMPQDGRITVKTSTKMVDMRISTLPTINGEKIVFRLLDRNAAIEDLDSLGLSKSNLAMVSRFVDQPQGLILATGPTGSGKTSTLYSMLQKGATPTKNFTTIEDPVEFFMGMAGQVMVKEKIGLSFPVVLRSLLRQDPNVVMLGEIRDFETAEVAFHAALTGHLVLSTLHTNGSVASITRLRDMGLKPYVISEALSGIIAQRLLRRICPNCTVDDHPSDETLLALKLDPDNLYFQPKTGKGCDKCNGTGMLGRIGIFEVFTVDSELKQLIHNGATEKELIRAAKWGGMTTLLDDALEKIRQGITTCEEAVRVLGPQNTFGFPCPHCERILEERFHFCPFCSKGIFTRCNKCGKMLEPSWNACPYCGN